MSLALADGEREVFQIVTKCFMVHDEHQRIGKGVPFVGRSGKNSFNAQTCKSMAPTCVYGSTEIGNQIF